MIEDQFNLKDQPKKKVTILVFEDNSLNEFYAKFTYNSREDIIKCSKNEKISDIFDKFISKEKVKMDKIFFIYQGETITEDDLKKTYDQLAI